MAAQAVVAVPHLVAAYPVVAVAQGATAALAEVEVAKDHIQRVSLPPALMALLVVVVAVMLDKAAVAVAVLDC